MASFRNFLITFLISVLLFGVIGYFTTVFVSGVVQGLIDSDGTSQEQNQNGSDPFDPNFPGSDDNEPEGNSFSFIIVLTDFDPTKYSDYIPTDWEAQNIEYSIDPGKDELGLLLSKSRHVHATAIILVKADKEHKEYLLCYISPETRVYTRSGAMSLGNLYGNYGINVLKDHVKALTGISPDFHFVLDCYKMNEVVETLGRYSFDLDSDIFSYGDYYMTSYNFTAEEKKAAFDQEPVNPDDADVETESNDYVKELVPAPVISRALFAGMHELDRETLTVVANLKECCLEDIELKGGYVLPAVEFYLRKFSEMSESGMSSVISSLTGSVAYASDSPLDEKPALATDFTTNDIGNVYGVVGALKRFGVNSMIYPGNYVSTHDAQIGYYVPTLRTAVEDLIKYR